MFLSERMLSNCNRLYKELLAFQVSSAIFIECLHFAVIYQAGNFSPDVTQPL
jgi:hypothetical protein